jgi:hypothetical protein
MSHFTVLVIGDDYEKQLAPFHEFECTGQDDEYVQDVEEIDEYIKDYDKDTKSVVIGPGGKQYDPSDEQFYREPTKEELEKHGKMMGSGVGGGLSWCSKDWKDGKGL